MATAKELQKPQILEVQAGAIRIKHPDISDYTSTYLRAPVDAAGTAITVADNNGFADNDWFIAGSPGDNKCEECDVDGAVARGQALTVTNTLAFGHSIDEPITKINERQIAIYGAATSGGALTEIIGPVGGDSLSIEWNKQFSEYRLSTTDTAYAFYVVRFYDGVTESASSDYVPNTGLARNTVGYMIKEALRLTDSHIDTKLITYDFLIGAANAAQDEITQFSFTDKSGNIVRKDWAFELVEDVDSITILTNENQYDMADLTYELKYSDSKQALLNVRMGDLPLDWWTIQQSDEYYYGVKGDRLEVGATAGDTSVTLVDSSLLSDDGSFSIGAESITYTANNKTTGVLSGIPAVGAGSIANNYDAQRAVWQSSSGGCPTQYTLFDNKIILNRPVSSEHNLKKLKIRYLRALDQLTELTDTTDVPFYNMMKWYIMGEIEYRKTNYEAGDKWMSKFNTNLLMNAKGDKTPILETYTYYNFTSGDNLDDYASGLKYPNY